MMIKSAMFVLAVPDLKRSAAYYRDVLGFEIQEMGDPGWRFYVQDACRIMAGECRDAMPVADTGDHSYFVYLLVDDADAFLARVTAAGADICKSIASEPWGMREFGVRTIDGHRMMIGQDIE